MHIMLVHVVFMSYQWICKICLCPNDTEWQNLIGEEPIIITHDGIHCLVVV